MAIAYGFVAREYVNLGEAPYRNVAKTMVTQARLAEPVVIWQQQRGWYEVEMSDTYRGWVAPMDLWLVDRAAWEQYQQAPQVLITAPFTTIYRDSDFTLSMKDAKSLQTAATMCTQLRLIAETPDNYQVLLPDGHAGYISKTDGEVIPGFNQLTLGSREKVVALAKDFLGLPYFLGGTTPYGYDCSGFVQTVLKMNGVHVQRDAHQQYEMGSSVAREELQRGDLVFFSTYKAGASHVGFYIAQGQYIHAGSSRGVAINSLNPGDEDYSEELDKKYLGAKRLLPEVQR